MNEEIDINESPETTSETVPEGSEVEESIPEVEESIPETQTSEPDTLEVEPTAEPITTDTYSIDDIVVRLDNLERLQVSFFNDVTDLLLFAVGVALGLLLLREFMDRATRW